MSMKIKRVIIEQGGRNVGRTAKTIPDDMLGIGNVTSGTV